MAQLTVEQEIARQKNLQKNENQLAIKRHKHLLRSYLNQIDFLKTSPGVVRENNPYYNRSLKMYRGLIKETISSIRERQENE